MNAPDHAALRVHLYCTVIDNFGDIGVCWRLARQLAQEYGLVVHLWVDDWLAARQMIADLPETAAASASEGVLIHAWSQVDAEQDCTGDVLIEGFGCTLPQPALAQLATRANKPLWVDLEYFSAEAWVEEFHLRSGYDRAGKADRWLFIPGVRAHSGGLLRERGLLAERESWQSQAHPSFLAQHALKFWPDTLKVLCFAYAHAPYTAWLDALATTTAPACLSTSLWLCGAYTQQAFATRDRSAFATVRWQNLPFISQPDFDRLLWSADVLWVRGEDSMARALWSGRPFIWQIYPQAENAHHAKLQAWLDYYAQPFSPTLRQAYIDAHLAWNGIEPANTLGPAWATLIAQWDQWRQSSHTRSRQCGEPSDLAQRLVSFVRSHKADQILNPV